MTYDNQKFASQLASNAEQDSSGDGTPIAQLLAMANKAGKAMAPDPNAGSLNGVAEAMNPDPNTPPIMELPARQAQPTAGGVSQQQISRYRRNAATINNPQSTANETLKSLFQKGVPADAGIPIDPSSVDVLWGHLPQQIRDQMPQVLGKTQLVGWRWSDLKDGGPEQALLAQLVLQGKKERTAKRDAVKSAQEKLDMLKKSLSDNAE
jgi:hypothetical protein